ncbi:MAG: glutamyl-tRNA reductase [Armatimonadota bacterium]|nr:glutamyl-tRNA reductase [bacterium]MDW8320206.1 glutamyl-tRNA reductase [Armatimonadota bacterium]
MQRLVLVGLSHRTASLETRERFAFEGEALYEALEWLRERGVEECVILSTCNRTEIYACSPRDDLLVRFLHEWEGLPEGSLLPCLYVKRGEEAIEHLFRVAAGLDSQVLGESEILGQVKQAWEKAREADATGVLLNSLFQRAVAVGKRVRAETALGKQVVSLGSLAVRAAMQHQPNVREATIIVIGTGTMGRRVVKELAELGPKALYILSHTFSYATALASDTGATPLALGALQQVLPEADIIFTATTAPHPILDVTCLAPLQSARAHRPLLILDLGVPRNTDPAVRLLPFVRLYDIEDLKVLSDAHYEARAREVPAALRIIEEELEDYRSWWHTRGAAPLIVALQQRAEQIRQQQLEWAMPKLCDLNDRQKGVVEQLTLRIVKQLLHHPIAELRKLLDDDDDALPLFAQMFGLEHLPQANVAMGASEEEL